MESGVVGSKAVGREELIALEKKAWKRMNTPSCIYGVACKCGSREAMRSLMAWPMQ